MSSPHPPCPSSADASNFCFGQNRGAYLDQPSFQYQFRTRQIRHQDLRIILRLSEDIIEGENQNIMPMVLEETRSPSRLSYSRLSELQTPPGPPGCRFPAPSDQRPSDRGPSDQRPWDRGPSDQRPALGEATCHSLSQEYREFVLSCQFSSLDNARGGREKPIFLVDFAI